MLQKFKDWCGTDILFFSLPLEQRVVEGWMSVGGIAISDAEQRVTTYYTNAMALGVRMFFGISPRLVRFNRVGTGVHIYFVENINEPEIAEFCDAGVPLDYIYPEMVQHNIEVDSVYGQMVHSGTLTVEDLCGPSPTKKRQRVSKLLTSICDRHPYRIIAADRLTLKAAFIDFFDATECLWIEKKILKVVPSAGQQVAPMAISEYIRTHQALYICWHGRATPAN
jgi:hypothetical protein